MLVYFLTLYLIYSHHPEIYAKIIMCFLGLSFFRKNIKTLPTLNYLFIHPKGNTTSFVEKAIIVVLVVNCLVGFGVRLHGQTNDVMVKVPV